MNSRPDAAISSSNPLSNIKRTYHIADTLALAHRYTLTRVDNMVFSLDTVTVKLRGYI